MYCQICSTHNPDGEEYCRRCHHKLLVISGSDYTVEDEELFDHREEQMSLDEHLLERISILEEVVRRLTHGVRQALGTLHSLEQKILVNHTGITTLRDLLEDKEILAKEQWNELWETRVDRQLLALEKRERFAAVHEQIAALYRGDERRRFEEILEQAADAFLMFDVGSALEALEAAHGLDPTNHELSFFLAETLFNEGELQSALDCFLRVLEERPNHFESLVYGGVLCYEQGNEERAEELLERAVGLAPSSFLPAFGLGTVYASRGRLAPAARHLERAVAAQPLPQALLLLGSCCWQMGRVTAAIRHLEEAVRRDPRRQEAHHLLGLAYLDRSWHRKAQAAFDDAQRLRPARLDHQQLMELLTGPEAGPSQISGEAFEWLRRAEDAFARDEARLALSCYRQALAHDGENPSLLVAYAMACLELGRTGEIESVVSKVLGLEPGERLKASACTTWIEALRLEGKFREGNRVGHLLLGEGDGDFARTLACVEIASNLAEMGEDLDQALSFARRAVEIAPPELAHLPLATLGWVHYRRREFRQSVEVLSRSNAIATSPRTLTHLGMALLAAGDRRRARRILAEARDAGRALPGSLFEALQYGSQMLHLPSFEGRE